MSATTTTGPGKAGLSDPLVPRHRGDNAAFIGSDGVAHSAPMRLAPDALYTEVTGGQHQASLGVHGHGFLPTGTGGAYESVADLQGGRAPPPPPPVAAPAAAVPPPPVAPAAGMPKSLRHA